MEKRKLFKQINSKPFAQKVGLQLPQLGREPISFGQFLRKCSGYYGTWQELHAARTT